MSTTDTEQLTPPEMATFNSRDEARQSFGMGRLIWESRDVAFMLVVEGRNLRGHKRVRVLDVEDIDAAGRPIYSVLDDDGVVSTVSEKMLYTEAGLFGTAANPSEYAKMIRERLRIARERALNSPPWDFELTLVMPEPAAPAPTQRTRRR